MVGQPLVGSRPFIIEVSISHSIRHIILARTPLDEGSSRRRYLYLTTHNTHKRQTSMSQAGFETTIPVSERLQTHGLDHAANEIGFLYILLFDKNGGPKLT
jgi:hypothetical protein